MVLCSKRAKEERALAAEQRIQALHGKASSSKHPIPLVVGDDSDSEDEKRHSETDYDRRRTLLEAIEEEDLDALRATALDPAHGFLIPSSGSSRERGDACPRDSTPTGSSIFSCKTSPDDPTSVRPKKIRKTSQSKLIFTSHISPTVTEATKAGQEDRWDCIVCTL